MELVCSICNGANLDDAVACDKCCRYYHLECVNEDKSVHNREWICNLCTPSTPVVGRKDFNESTIATPTVYFAQPAAITHDEEGSRGSEQPAASAMPIIATSSPNHVANSDAQTPDAKLEEISRCFHRLMEELESSREQRREEPSIVERLESVLGGFVQRMERSNGAEARGSSGRQPFSVFDDEGLSRSQIATRQAVKGKLPYFSGNPDEWLMFESCYNETTRLCGFTDGENTIRLQQALKGKALKAVQCRLREKDNLKEVLETLKSMYGRPEIVVSTLLDQVRHQTPPKGDKLDTLIDFAISVEEICATLRSSDVENRFDGPLLQELVDRLPPFVRLQWGIHCVTTSQTTLQEFGKWIKVIKKGALHVTPPSPSTESRKRVNTHVEQPKSVQRCACDKGCRNPADCEAYNKMSVTERWNLIRQNSWCKHCLKKHQNPCRESRVCAKDNCTARHHPTLHNSNSASSKAIINFSHSTTAESDVLLRHVPVVLHAGNKTIHTVALLDEGASVSLMEHSLVEELGVSGTLRPLCLKWTGGQHRYENKSMDVSIGISGIRGNDHVYEIAVRTVHRLGLPAQRIKPNELRAAYKHLSSVPFSSYRDTPPKLLIGMNNYHITVPLKTVEGPANEPIATKTRLGWTISGCISPQVVSDKAKVIAAHFIEICQCQNIDTKIDAALKGGFALDGPYNRQHVSTNSKKEERAISILTNNTKLVNERYVTALLWRYDDVKLPDNRALALKRLTCLERRMAKETYIKIKMDQILADHVKKGYIRKLTDQEKKTAHPRKWYLPIFPVVNPNKPGKVRIVWDAAASVNGVSLNSMLLTGPDLLAPLTSVLCRFREFRIAMAADIQEMYHQVLINEEDQNSQRFLWKSDASQKEPDEYVMMRMTFGAACSPSCAQFIKNANADRYAEQFPLAAECIKTDHYVDDMLTSVETLDEAIKLAKDVTYIQSQGGFKLHNWMANKNEILQAVGGNGNRMKDMTLDQSIATQKVLGMWWDAHSDTFQFKLPNKAQEVLQGEIIPTKRQLLSVLMTIFDPLGLIGAFMLFLKVLLQEVWRAGTGWDEKIPTNLESKWKKWLTCLPELQKFSVPRCYRITTDLSSCTNQLHVFVDAGKDGYAAVAYFRIESNGQREVALIGGKTRVAPLKYISIPRLELQAAVLGIRLAKIIEKAHRIPIHRRFLWTDSKDVLCWLNSDHRRYSVYVAHRVGEILENSTLNEWHWIPTLLNVADEGTKWSNLDKHTTFTHWFNGPSFLLKPEDEWDMPTLKVQSTDEEMRQTITVHQLVHPIISIERFSRWRRLQRAVAYVWRFINNARQPKASRIKGPLTHLELQQAERTVLIQAQRQEYPDEYRTLQEGVANTKTRRIYLKKSSPLFRRSPYLDEDGVIRLHGRIDACQHISDEMKRPIILPKTGHLTDLIIDDYHRRYQHANHQTVMNEVRQKFDVPALRSACHRIRNNCAKCKIRIATPTVPMMCELPAARLSPFCRPFSFTGIDYFGPFLVAVGRRQEKRWGVLFTCLTIRAIHIEVASSLSTSSCIIALRNFIARRGTPLEIYSDRGTNFIGANRELKEAMAKINTNELIEVMHLPDTKWNFNPPAAPHFGGAWERLVQTVKRTLNNMQFTRTPSDAVFTNWLIEVEMIVNSRPLTQVPVENEEEAPLTPNHFILGSSAGTKPLSILDDSTACLRNNWKASQSYANVFWRKWVASYLPTLTRRSKWFQTQRTLKEDDLVLIVDDNLPRGCWPKGRVVRTVPSKNGEIRQVHVKLANGKVLERPVVKIAVVDIEPRGGVLTDQNTGVQCCEQRFA